MSVHRPLAIVSKPMDRDGRWECKAKQGLECACLAEAEQQFTQANQTPCFMTPLWEIFGELGVCHWVFDEVLEGNFIPPEDCNPYAKNNSLSAKKTASSLRCWSSDHNGIYYQLETCERRNILFIFNGSLWPLHGQYL